MRETAAPPTQTASRYAINARLSALFWGVFGLGAALRLLGLNKGIWLDEYVSVSIAHEQNFLAALRADDHPPLYYILLRAVLYASDSEMAARLFSVLFGIATLLLLMLWVRRYSLQAGILAGMLGGSAPILLRYSQEVRPYPILLFATALAFYFAWAITRQPQRAANYVGLASAFILAVMSHLVGPGVVIMVLVYMLASGLNLRRVRWRGLAAAIVIPAAIFLFHYLLFSQRDFADWWMPPLSVPLVGDTVRALLDTDTLFWPVRLAHDVFPPAARLADVTLKMLLVIIVASLTIGEWREAAPLVVSTAAYTGLVVLFSLLGKPIFWSRTLLPCLIPLIAFVAVQLDGIRLPSIRSIALVSVSALCLALSIIWAVYAAWQPIEPYRQVAQMLQSKWQPNNLVIVYPAYIEGPVRYNAPNLPEATFLPLARNFDPLVAESDVEHRLAEQLQAQPDSPVFLLVREDAIVQQDGERYAALQAELRQRLGEPVEVDTEGLLSLHVYRISRQP